MKTELWTKDKIRGPKRKDNKTLKKPTLADKNTKKGKGCVNGWIL